MSTTTTVIYLLIALVLVAVVVAIVIGATRASRTRALAQRFGPEYDRTVRAHGDRVAAERELAARESRVRKFHIEELPPGAKQRYTEEWMTVQSRFVDAPREAVVDADHLVSTVMRDRGYPMENFEQRAADISPDHPNVVADYRVAHDIAVRSEHGEIPTEDLRQAMQHYRTLFDDLLESNKRNQK